MLGLLLAVRLAFASGYYVESVAVGDREQAARLQEQARAAGVEARVIRRFRLGHGWEFALLADGLEGEAAATVAAGRLAAATALKVTVFREEGARSVAVEAPPAPAPEQPAMTAAQWITRVDEALGGATGGGQALARAAAVHFVFERRFRIGGSEATIEHEYWREGGFRRLDVRTRGAGTDSVAVSSPTAAWLVVGGTRTSRDIGVVVGTIDGFAPEAVLALPLAAHDVLGRPATERFQVLDGGDTGLRLGEGADDVEEGLAWLDVDPERAYPVRARYVTDAGPLEWEFSEWRTVSPGVVVPFEAQVVRPDGARESIRVTRIEVLPAAPGGTFDAPGG